MIANMQGKGNLHIELAILGDRQVARRGVSSTRKELPQSLLSLSLPLNMTERQKLSETSGVTSPFPEPQ